MICRALYTAVHYQLLITISTVVAASVIQHPLLKQVDTRPLKNTKPLISSDAIQDDISTDKLLARAKYLSNLAELSFEEYNHPTRVIGSQGKLICRFTSQF